MTSEAQGTEREARAAPANARQDARPATRTVWLALAGSALYASARYQVFGTAPWSDWPMYTLNKVFALAALVLLVVAVARRRFGQGQPIAPVMAAAGALFALHGVISLALLSPAYYGKFYFEGKLTALAGVAIVLGIIAAAALAAGARPAPGRGAGEKAGRLALLAFAVGLHAALPGLASWLAPSAWPGMMPPITLVSFVLGTAALAIAWSPRDAARLFSKPVRARC